jgi:hypothetical protein
MADREVTSGGESYLQARPNVICELPAHLTPFFCRQWRSRDAGQSTLFPQTSQLLGYSAGLSDDRDPQGSVPRGSPVMA